jgi:hypothetical protein
MRPIRICVCVLTNIANIGRWISVCEWRLRRDRITRIWNGITAYTRMKLYATVESMHKTFTLLLAALAGCAALAHTGAVQAQAWPARSIRMIVPFPPGGFADVFGRILAEKFSSAWGQPVVVENRAGGGGNIGADIVAKSPGDGYTLVIGTVGTHAINATLFSRLPYDPVKDFTPVAFVVEAEGLRFMPTTPGQFDAFVRSEVAHWAPVVNMSGAKVD